TVMDHQTAVATPRAGPEMVEIAAFVVNDRRHTSLPSATRENFCHGAVTKSIRGSNVPRARLRAGRPKERATRTGSRTDLVSGLLSARHEERCRERWRSGGATRRSPLRQRRAARRPPTAEGTRLHVRRSRRGADPGCRGAPSHPPPCDPTRVDRRLDLAEPAWPHSSHRTRRARPQAISLSRTMARGAGRGQIRPA